MARVWQTNLDRYLPEELWNKLDGRVWHATSLRRAKAILKCSEIRVQEDGYHGLNKYKGRICVFDFGNTSRDCFSQGHWSEWCGYQQAISEGNDAKVKIGVWLEVKVELLDKKFYTAKEVGEESQALINSGNGKHSRHIPGCEGGIEGRIAVEAIGEGLAITQADKMMVSFPCFSELALEQIVEWRRSLE